VRHRYRLHWLVDDGVEDVRSHDLLCEGIVANFPLRLFIACSERGFLHRLPRHFLIVLGDGLVSLFSFEINVSLFAPEVHPELVTAVLTLSLVDQRNHGILARWGLEGDHCGAEGFHCAEGNLTRRFIRCYLFVSFSVQAFAH